MTKTAKEIVELGLVTKGLMTVPQEELAAVDLAEIKKAINEMGLTDHLWIYTHIRWEVDQARRVVSMTEEDKKRWAREVKWAKMGYFPGENRR